MSETFARALPMWQPWASLVVRGVKCVETRSSRPPGTVLGRRIAIHATLHEASLAICRVAPFDRFIAEPRSLPLGALIGTVRVTGALQISASTAAELQAVDYTEWCLGDYTPGRWAWRLAEPVEFAEPVRWTGKQGIMLVPAELVGIMDEPEQGSLL